AVGDGEGVITGETPRTRPADRRAVSFVDQRLQLQTVVRDHRPEHDDAALVDQPFVALATLQVVLPWKATGVGDDELDGAVVHPLVHGVLDGEDRRVEPVGEQLADVHVDEYADLGRLERVALCRATAGRGIDDDLAVRLLADTAAALVPSLAGRAGGLAGVGPGGHVRDGPVGLSDAVVGGRREEALGPGPLGRCGFHDAELYA